MAEPEGIELRYLCVCVGGGEEGKKRTKRSGLSLKAKDNLVSEEHWAWGGLYFNQGRMLAPT